MRNVKIFAIILILMLMASYSMAQGVAINTDGATADGSAMLDVKSTSSGMLIPRMSLAQRNSLTLPAHSLLIYQTDNTPGYYYNSGTPASPVWVRLATGSTVDGSGVATRVAFWTGTTTLGSNANLYWDNANSWLGIGTASPTNAKLQIEGSGTYDGVLRIRNTGASGANVFFVASNTSWTFGTNKLGIGLGDPSSTNIKMTIQENGNVGIGTISPVSKLNVRGKSTFTIDGVTECCGNDATIALGENTAGTGRTARISFHNAGISEGSLELYNGAPRRLRIYDNQSQGMGLQMSGPLYVDGTGNSYIQGNVGIGTTAPGYRLDLANGTFAFGNANQRTETRDNAGLQGNAGAQSGFFETASPSNYPAGASSWWHLIDVRHSNTGYNYAMQFAGSFYDQKLYFRKTNGSPTTPWTEVITNSSLNADITIDYSTSSITTNASWQNIPGLARTIYLNAGDRVFIDASGAIMVPTYWTSADIGISPDFIQLVR